MFGNERSISILIVDDSPSSCQVIKEMIQDDSHSVYIANSGSEALAIMSEHSINLVIMDIEMPEMNGFQLTRIIREQNNHWIPIIFLSAIDSEDYLAKGIDTGGDDYLTKPVKAVILNAKIKAMARIAQMQFELDAANKKLEQLSSVDPLTGLLNRRALNQLFKREWQNYQRTQVELSILMVDIDFFKQYNDSYGHQKGDECLQIFAKVLQKYASRTNDIVARYGGEEFIVVLPNTPLIGARFKAKEILKSLNSGLIEQKFSDISPYVTASIGIASTAENVKDVNELIKFADEAMYEAKRLGRNRSVVYKMK